MRRNLALYAVYLVIAVIVTYPLAFRLGDVLAGFEYSDAREMAHHLWWFGEALRTGENPFFMSNLAYPDGIDAITLWANPLQFFPAWALALILPLPMAANVTILGMMALNGWAMAYFFSRLTQNHAAAFLAGVVFMLFPTMQGHLGAGHAGLLVQFPVPLYALALLNLTPNPLSTVERGRIRPILIAALWFVVSGWGHTLQILYVTLPLTAILMLPPLFRRDWRTLGRMIGAVVIGMAALIVYLLPTFREAFSSTYADEGGGVRYSADLLSAVSPSFFHPVWDRLLDYPRRVLGVNLDEGAAYIGLFAGILALIAVIRVKGARIWLAFAALAYLLSLGALLKVFNQPVALETDGYLSYITLPFALVADLPGVNLMRAPGRFNFGLAFAVAVMAGYGFDALFKSRLRAAPRRYGIVVMLAALIAFDYQTFFPLPTTPAAIPQPIYDLASRSDIRAVFGVPWEYLITAKADLYYQTAHRQALIAGQVTRRTPVDPAMLYILQSTFDPALLDEAGADIVVVHRELDFGNLLFQRANEKLGEPLYVDDDIALFDVPPPTQPIPFARAWGYVESLLDGANFSDYAELHMYAPESGWVEYSLTVLSETNSDFMLASLDGTPIQRFPHAYHTTNTIVMPVDAGYHTLRLAFDPPCPRIIPIESLVCYGIITTRSITYSADSDFAPTGVAQFGRGVTLGNWRLTHQDDTISAWLDWQFAEPITANDIRFVHVIDESGMIIAQSDVPVGDIEPDTRRVESVNLTLPADLPAGRYTIYAGWYAYPDIVRFPLLSAPEGANARQADNLLILGTFDVPP